MCEHLFVLWEDFVVLERASGTFIVDGQVEDILGGISGAARIARISQSCRFAGQLEGESIAEFTAVLPRDGDGSFHGFQRIAATLGEREGTFVVSVSGEYVKGQPKGSWTIVPKSGSGDFAHIRGSGTFSLPDGKPGKYQLEFDLRKPRAAKAVKEETVEDVPIEVLEPVASDIPSAVDAKPTHKSRATKVEPAAEVAVELPVKRARARKVASPPVEAVIVADLTPKRTRARKIEAPVTEPIVTEPVTKPKRPRKTAEVEPIVSVAEPVAVKPVRRKKPVSPEPIALPVAEPTASRKRRATAA